MTKKIVKRTDANNEILYFYTHSDAVDVGEGNSTTSLTAALNSKASTSDVQALSDDALRKSPQSLSSQEKSQVHNNLSTESFIDDRAVRYDEPQVLGSDEKTQALTNLGLNGVDAEPTKNSQKMVRSGGVAEAIDNVQYARFDGIQETSVTLNTSTTATADGTVLFYVPNNVFIYKVGNTYYTLWNNTNRLTNGFYNDGESTPHALTMKIFINTEDGLPYSFDGTDFTTVVIDDEPTPNSNNLVKSGGVFHDLLDIQTKLKDYSILEQIQIIQNDGELSAYINNGTILANERSKVVYYRAIKGREYKISANFVYSGIATATAVGFLAQDSVPETNQVGEVIHTFNGTEQYVNNYLPQQSGWILICIKMAGSATGTDIKVESLKAVDFQAEINNISEIVTMQQADLDDISNLYKEKEEIQSGGTIDGRITVASMWLNTNSTNYHNLYYQVSEHKKLNISAIIVRDLSTIAAITFFSGESLPAYGSIGTVLQSLTTGDVNIEFTPPSDGYLLITNNISGNVFVNNISILSSGDYIDFQGDITDIQGDISAIEDSIYEKINYIREDFKDGYLSTSSKAIGDTVGLPNDANPVSSSSNAGHLTLSVKKDDFITIEYKSLSGIYCRAFVILNASKQIVAWANPQTNSLTQETYNTFGSPLKIRAEQDGFVILQFVKADYDDNALMSVVHHKQKGKDAQLEAIEVCVPDIIYAVVGDTLQLYYRSIFRCVDFTKYAVKVVCDIGAQYPRYYEITPLIGNIGTHTLSFTIKDNNNNALGTKTINLVVVSEGTNPSNELNVLCLGASATQGGQWASEFKRRLVGTGGTPVASGKTNIQFVGRKDVTFSGQQVNLEATGGYGFPSYTRTSVARYRFDVTEENEPIINIGDIYSTNGNNYTIVEINITTGQGGYFSCEGSGSPQYSGTLTKVSGTGSNNIIYSSSKYHGNPFVYNGVIDMQQYADDYCNPQGAAHGKIDVIYTELFGNSMSVYIDDFTTMMSQMQVFITQTLAVFQNCKFCIGLFWNPDIRGGMGVNYGASGNWSDPYGIKYSNMNLCNALQKYITDNNLSEYVYILNWLNEFDEENDMQQTTKKVNTRSSVTEIFGVNGVHPAVVGYNQMADTAWRLFVAKFCQST